MGACVDDPFAVGRAGRRLLVLAICKLLRLSGCEIKTLQIGSIALGNSGHNDYIARAAAVWVEGHVSILQQASTVAAIACSDGETRASMVHGTCRGNDDGMYA